MSPGGQTGVLGKERGQEKGKAAGEFRCYLFRQMRVRRRAKLIMDEPY